MKQGLIFLGAVACMIAVTSCATKVPEGITPVEGFELDRYLGQWYEIGRLDHPFERDMTDVTADYALKKPGVVSVTNQGYLPGSDEPKTAVGKAKFIGSTTRGSLKVSFFGPFYGGYHIFALDQDAYQHAMIAGPSRDYLWILSRTPTMDEATFDDLVEQARDAGFPVDALIRVSQDRYTEGQIQ